MIKFFRKTRKNLLNYQTERAHARRNLSGWFSGRAGGKTVKYFKYEIGEIILVVIGILIALSINNQTDSRKKRI